MNKESPESTNVWHCDACGNDKHFKLIDFDTYGGPDVCHCGAVERGQECGCVTTLVQPVTILRNDAGNFVEVEYSIYAGGGADAEIGQADKIICAKCGAVVWIDPTYDARYGLLDGRMWECTQGDVKENDPALDAWLAERQGRAK